MKKSNLVVIAEIAIFAALGYIFDLIAQGFSAFWPNGGSIGISIIPIIVISYRRGIGSGLIVGLIMGLLDCIDGTFYTFAGEWYLVFLQVGFDYIFCYALVALGALIKNAFKKESKMNFALGVTVATFIGGLLKYFSHFMSGVLFWPEFEGQPLWGRVVFSLGYNGGYMVPCIVISCIVIFALAYKAPQLFKSNN